MIYKSLLSCSYNTRELGSIKTSDGGITKNNIFWRSDVTSVPTEEDIEKLLSANITTIIDMRTDEEVQKTPNGLAGMAGFEYHHFPITEGSGVPESLEVVPRSYMDIALAKNMPYVMKTIAESDSGVLFHCTAGKDRTGTVAALLLGFCGVDDLDIIANYQVTETYILGSTFLDTYADNVQKSDAKYIRTLIMRLKETYGTYENYLLSCGLSKETLNKIKDKFLKDFVV
jgi:protein-tyrosine phosphatase